MYNLDEKNSLLEQVTISIEYGLKNQNQINVNKTHFSNNLVENRACFVTLHLKNNLRGCIGSLNASKPLIEDVNFNAYAAAFEDPRFPKLTKDEFVNISTEISVLSIPEEIIFSTENDLLSKLRIGIDGMIFEYESYRATYLPSVWSSLPIPKLFLNSLKEKSGLNANFWSKDVRCYRYTTEIIK
ncbi:MAG: AmmeMemoRadiSam system protein A [Thiohalomonadales bacterium]